MLAACTEHGRGARRTRAITFEGPGSSAQPELCDKSAKQHSTTPCGSLSSAVSIFRLPCLGHTPFPKAACQVNAIRRCSGAVSNCNLLITGSWMLSLTMYVLQAQQRYAQLLAEEMPYTPYISLAEARQQVRRGPCISKAQALPDIGAAGCSHQRGLAEPPEA